MNTLTSFIGTSIALIGWEFVKQIGVQTTRRVAPQTVVVGLQVLDRIFPDLIAEGVSGEELEVRVRKELGTLTGDDWLEIRNRFDPVVFANKNSH